MDPLDEQERIIHEASDILAQLGWDHPDAAHWIERRRAAIEEADRLVRERWSPELRWVVERAMARYLATRSTP